MKKFLLLTAISSSYFVMSGCGKNDDVAKDAGGTQSAVSTIAKEIDPSNKNDIAALRAQRAPDLEFEKFDQQTNTESETADIGDPNLAVDLNLAPGTLRGQSLRDWHEASLRRTVGTLDQENRAILRARSAEFALVAAAIDRVYQSVDNMKRAAFAPEYQAAKRDLERLREFAVYDCTFPVPADIVRKSTRRTDLTESMYMASIIIGQNQIDMWHRGMMSWGVYYDISKGGCWPTGMLNGPPNQISQGGQRIYKGDWSGAWLLNGGRVYVPGVAFFALTQLKIQRAY